LLIILDYQVKYSLILSLDKLAFFLIQSYQHFNGTSDGFKNIERSHERLVSLVDLNFAIRQMETAAYPGFYAGGTSFLKSKVFF